MIKKGSYRVLRGGSWCYGAQYLRAAGRDYDVPGIRDYYIGFRLVRTPSTLLPSYTSEIKVEQALAKARQALKEIEELLK
jgi:hypothetical protein